MSHHKIALASDNWSPVHPAVMDALLTANQGYAPAYGADIWTEQAQALLQKEFPSSCASFIVPSGTGSNVFGLRLACRRHESILCTNIAHIYYQESGAAESLIGCKLIPVAHSNGKLTPEAITKTLIKERAFGKHSTAPRIVSITQPTEVGTIYTLEELHHIAALCRQEHLLLHIDGSRLYNAAASIGSTLQDITDAAQCDILSLGGTKNGLMGAEAHVIFNTSLLEGSHHVHKQTLQLMSKMRYLSAQYIPLLENKLWHTLADHANKKAQELASVIEKTPQLTLSYPVETNQIFFTAPPTWIPLIQEHISCYSWDLEKHELRCITSWNTSPEEIQAAQNIFQTLR